MKENSQKTFLRVVIGGCFLAFALTSCGQGNYSDFEECRLKEVQKLSRDSKELSDEALSVISGFCDKYPTRSEQDEKKAPPKDIADPKLEKIATEKGKSRGEAYLIDVNNIEIKDFEKTFWFVKLEKGQNLEDKTFLMEKVSVNCADGTISRLSSSNYKEGKSEGNVIDPTPETVIPGSLGADVYRYICERK